jgi:hypothetical protein
MNTPTRYLAPSLTLFVSQVDFLHFALEAYRAASKAQQPPPGEPWLDRTGAPWSDARDFHNGLLQELEARQRRRAHLTGHQLEQHHDASSDNAPLPPADPPSPEAMAGRTPEPGIPGVNSRTPLRSTREDRL